MNIFRLGKYMLTGKSTGKLPIDGCSDVSLRAAEEGIVLLKNDGVLPLKQNGVALFGCGASDTTVCGTGSGYAFAPYNVTIEEGLRKEGLTICSELWLKNYEKYKTPGDYHGKKKMVNNGHSKQSSACFFLIPIFSPQGSH